MSNEFTKRKKMVIKITKLDKKLIKRNYITLLVFWLIE